MNIVAAVDDCDQVPTTVTTVTTGQQSDSAGSSSRAASPKSGYNSDVEGEIVHSD